MERPPPEVSVEESMGSFGDIALCDTCQKGAKVSAKGTSHGGRSRPARWSPGEE